MSTTHADRGGPDLIRGISSRRVPAGGCLVGSVGDEAVLVVRTSSGLRAVQAACPHYGAPLADGCIHEGRLHCPWHHASFDLHDGAVGRPPALDPLKTWSVEEKDGLIRVLHVQAEARARRTPPKERGRVVVVGAGAAGTAAVLALREAGHAGALLLIDPDPEAPFDRPNLSKDYLAGTAPEEWLPLRTSTDWEALGVERVVDAVTRLHAHEQVLELESSRSVAFDGAILATGAEPRRLRVPGADRPHVHYLRSLNDCRALRAHARDGTEAVLIGAGFIGLEAAAAFRSRGVDVTVVAPEAVPLAGVLGTELGTELVSLHERHGVRFCLESGVREIAPERVVLVGGRSIPADLVVVAIGVNPRLALADDAGVPVDDGILVDSFLESRRAGIFAAGDIARFPDPRGEGTLRIEHWSVAQSQGRTAALNLLGHRRPFDDVPFFWTSHYGMTLQWTGFPGAWDVSEIDGSLREGSLAARFMRGGRPQAGVFVGRDQEGLQWEFAMANEIVGVAR